jgi:hypothetical protein
VTFDLATEDELALADVHDMLRQNSQELIQMARTTREQAQRTRESLEAVLLKSRELLEQCRLERERE